MKNLLSTIVLFLLVLSAFGQNYYPVNRKDIYYFSDSSNTIAFSLKIDSVKAVGQDSIYYMFKQIREGKSSLIPQICYYNGLSDSWLGNTIRVKPDGSCILLDKKRDEFLIKTSANLNDSWIAYQNSTWKAQMTVSSKKLETFLGLTDSVKTFTINILKLNDTDTSHQYDGLQFKISKNYGFIKLLNTYQWDLPNYTGIRNPNNDNYLYNSSIVGMQNPKLGLYNFSIQELYDYTIGDVFQYYYWEYFGREIPYSITEYSDSVVSKIATDSSFIYKINRRSKKLIYTTNEIFFTTDTLSNIYYFNENQYYTNLKQFNFYYDTNLKTWGKERILGVSSSIHLNDTCISLAVPEYECPPFYIIGLGETQKGCGLLTGGRDLKLVYYKKGSKTWGQRILLGIDNNESITNSNFKLSPNPASNNIHYSLTNQIKEGELRLLDVLGNVTFNTPLNQDEGNIDVSKFGRGIYFYQIISSNKPVLSGKIVLE